jgi:hypothetical protein
VGQLGGPTVPAVLPGVRILTQRFTDYWDREDLQRLGQPSRADGNFCVSLTMAKMISRGLLVGLCLPLGRAQSGGLPYWVGERLKVTSAILPPHNWFGGALPVRG